jgi:hydrogenase nickel incorporation protein HypB
MADHHFAGQYRVPEYPERKELRKYIRESDGILKLSSTEGEDKPLKYPTIFNTADIALLTKMDLAAAVEFDRAAALANIQSVRPGMHVLEVSTKSGQGMDEIVALFEEKMRAMLRQPEPA